MTYLFYIICGMATVHFIYERIILPSIRLNYRAELFKIRDTVRNEMLFSNLSNKDMKAAKLVHDGLNNAINRLHLLTISNKYFVVERIMLNPELKNAMIEYAEAINKCESKVIKGALIKANQVMDCVFAANTIFTFIYFLPFILLIVFLKYILRGIKATNSRLLELFKIKQSKEFKETLFILPDSKIKEFSKVSI